MSVNGISGAVQAYDNRSTSKSITSQSKQTDTVKQNESAGAAAVYEKDTSSVNTKNDYQRDDATINRLLAEVDKRAQSLRDLVQRMLLKQGQTYTEATDIYAVLREGKLDVDEETKAQAQKDIAEDGYWGMEQTSDRLVSFAKALTGGDSSKADDMITAVKKGFDEATKAWGDELPDISKKTLDAAIRKLEAWRDSEKADDDMGSQTADEFKNQAAEEALG